MLSMINCHAILTWTTVEQSTLPPFAISSEIPSHKALTSSNSTLQSYRPISPTTSAIAWHKDLKSSKCSKMSLRRRSSKQRTRRKIMLKKKMTWLILKAAYPQKKPMTYPSTCSLLSKSMPNFSKLNSNGSESFLVCGKSFQSSTM